MTTIAADSSRARGDERCERAPKAVAQQHYAGGVCFGVGKSHAEGREGVVDGLVVYAYGFGRGRIGVCALVVSQRSHATAGQPQGYVAERMVGPYGLVAVKRARPVHHDHHRERPFARRISYHRRHAPPPGDHRVGPLFNARGQRLA